MHEISTVDLHSSEGGKSGSPDASQSRPLIAKNYNDRDSIDGKCI